MNIAIFWNYGVEQNIYKFLFCIVNSWDEVRAKNIVILQPSRKTFHMNLDIDTDDWSCKEVNFRHIKSYGKQMFVFNLTFCIVCDSCVFLFIYAYLTFK